MLISTMQLAVLEPKNKGDDLLKQKEQYWGDEWKMLQILSSENLPGMMVLCLQQGIKWGCVICGRVYLSA